MPGATRPGAPDPPLRTVVDVVGTVLELPYRVPLVTATNRFDVARGLLVAVHLDDGTIGYGYADMFPRAGETARSAVVLLDDIRGRIVGRPIRSRPAIEAAIDTALLGNPRLRSAVDAALLDALARSAGIPLAVLFGGIARDRLRIIRSISVGEPAAMAEAALQVLDGGGSLKLKVEGHVERDGARARAVRAAVGEDVWMKVDCNEAFDGRDAVTFAHRLADAGVDTIEQPVRRDRWAQLAEVTRRSPIRVEADQSVRSAADAAALIAAGAVDAINTGAARVGSLAEARRIAERCDAAGIRCSLTATAGSVVGDAAALHLAAAIPSIADRCELAEWQGLDGDPFPPLVVEGGWLVLPDGPGIGIGPRHPQEATQ